MVQGENRKTLLDRYRALSRGKRLIIIVFVIWAVQAIPKWTLAIVGDGQVAAGIMKIFVTPR